MEKGTLTFEGVLSLYDEDTQRILWRFAQETEDERVRRERRVAETSDGEFSLVYIDVNGRVDPSKSVKWILDRDSLSKKLLSVVRRALPGVRDPLLFVRFNPCRQFTLDPSSPDDLADLSGKDEAEDRKRAVKLYGEDYVEAHPEIMKSKLYGKDRMLDIIANRLLRTTTGELARVYEPTLFLGDSSMDEDDLEREPVSMYVQETSLFTDTCGITAREISAIPMMGISIVGNLVNNIPGLQTLGDKQMDFIAELFERGFLFSLDESVSTGDDDADKTIEQALPFLITADDVSEFLAIPPVPARTHVRVLQLMKQSRLITAGLPVHVWYPGSSGGPLRHHWGSRYYTLARNLRTRGRGFATTIHAALGSLGIAGMRYALEAHSDAVLIFRGYLPRVVRLNEYQLDARMAQGIMATREVAPEYLASSLGTHALIRSIMAREPDPAETPDDRIDRQKREEMKHDINVTLWFPVFVRLDDEATIPGIGKTSKGKPGEEMAYNLLLRNYEFPVYNEHKDREMLGATGEDTTRMIVWSTSDPKPNAAGEINMTRIYYKQGPEAVQYDEDAAAVFDRASKGVDPVYSTDERGRLHRSQFVNGPIMAVGDRISRFPDPGTVTKHGIRVSLEEFHAAHMEYRRITEHQTTENYVPSDGMGSEAHVLRMVIEHGDTDNIRTVVDPLPPLDVAPLPPSEGGAPVSLVGARMKPVANVAKKNNGVFHLL